MDEYTHDDGSPEASGSNWEFAARPELGTGATPLSAPSFEPVAPTPSRSRAFLTTAVALATVAALLGVTLGHFAWPSGSSTPQSQIQAAPSPNNDDGTGSSAQGTSASAATQAVSAKISPALVDINTNLGYQGAQAAGTGVVISSDGLVLTNNHVIDSSTSISATDLGNNKTYTATVVGYDRSHDIAVLRLQGATGLTVAPLGNSSTVQVGQAVIGIGNAGGTGGTPSAASGTVTALNQSITASDESSGSSEQLTGLLQTDAPIQPGDSGGPLVTMSDKIIGIDTAASSTYSFSNQGSQGFAIPINTALSIAHQITAGKASSTIHLGSTAFLGVKISSSNLDPSSSGAYVAGVVSGSPADKAGIQAGDTITAVNGTQIASAQDLPGTLTSHRPGDVIHLTWTDSAGTSQTASLTLATGPAA